MGTKERKLGELFLASERGDTPKTDSIWGNKGLKNVEKKPALQSTGAW